MGRRRPGRIRKLTPFTEPLIALAAAFAVILAVISGFAFLLTKIDAKTVTLSVMSTVALGAGAFIGGYVSAKLRKKNGLFMGVICGLFIFITVIILSAFFSKAVGSFSPSAKLIVTLICAGTGGVIGVNSRKKF